MQDQPPIQRKANVRVPDLLSRNLKCKKCYGRGYIGDRIVNKLGQRERVYCKCVPWITLEKSSAKYDELKLVMQIFYVMALMENLAEIQSNG